MAPFADETEELVICPPPVEPAGGLRPCSLRANFAWTFLGHATYMASQWGQVVAIAKLTSAAKVGQFALALAVTAPVNMLAGLQLRTVQATDARHDYVFGDYLALRLLGSVVTVLVTAAIALVGYRGETALVIIVIGLAKSIEAISDIIWGLLQQHERMDRVSHSMMIKGPLSLGALALAVYITKSTLWGATGLAVAWLVTLLTYDAASGARVLGGGSGLGERSRLLRPRWHWPTLWRLTMLSSPMGVVRMLATAKPNIPRYFIQYYQGAASLGIFSALAYLVVAGTAVVEALGQSASPRLAQYFAAGRIEAFMHLAERVIIIAALLGLGGVGVAVWLGKPLLVLLYRPEYAEHATVLVWIAIGAGVTYVASILNYIFAATRAFSRLLSPYVIITASTLVLSAALVPHYGLMGAAWALLVSSVVHVVVVPVALIPVLRRSLRERQA
jgi:O-antigen/teichoic acid export membrane protein